MTVRREEAERLSTEQLRTFCSNNIPLRMKLDLKSASKDTMVDAIVADSAIHLVISQNFKRLLATSTSASSVLPAVEASQSDPTTPQPTRADRAFTIGDRLAKPPAPARSARVEAAITSWLATKNRAADSGRSSRAARAMAAHYGQQHSATDREQER